MSKGALLIGLDRALQVLGPFGSQPNGVPRRLRIPKVFKERITAIEVTPMEPVRDRSFRLAGETRDYWIYEEEDL